MQSRAALAWDAGGVPGTQIPRQPPPLSKAIPAPTCSRLAKPRGPRSRSWRSCSTSAASDRTRRAWSASPAGPGMPASAPRLQASWARSREVCCLRPGEPLPTPSPARLWSRGPRKAPGRHSSLARDQTMSTVSRAPRLGTSVGAAAERKASTACSDPGLSRDCEAWDHRIWARAGPLRAMASLQAALAFSSSHNRASSLPKWGLTATRRRCRRVIVCGAKEWVLLEWVGPWPCWRVRLWRCARQARDRELAHRSRCSSRG